MKNIICLIFLSALSCINTKEKIDNKELLNILNLNTIQYFETNNQEYLQSAYEKLNQNKDYRNKGLTSENSKLVISLLLNLKKYDELEKLLEKDITLNKYNRIITLNTVKYLKYSKENKEKANSYIKENIAMINDSLNKKPQDSLLYGDYFSNRMFLVGKKNVLMEIDSMQKSNKKYSDFFYQEILKESIQNYPDELLPNK